MERTRTLKIEFDVEGDDPAAVLGQWLDCAWRLVECLERELAARRAGEAVDLPAGIVVTEQEFEVARREPKPTQLVLPFTA